MLTHHKQHLLSNVQSIGNKEHLTSPNGKFHGIVQEDGNFVVYKSRTHEFIGENAVWASDTWHKGHGPYKLVMQEDGNLVLYDSHNAPTWSTGTYIKGKIGHYTLLTNDRHLVLYDCKQEELWRSPNIYKFPIIKYRY